MEIKDTISEKKNQTKTQMHAANQKRVIEVMTKKYIPFKYLRSY